MPRLLTLAGLTFALAIIPWAKIPNAAGVPVRVERNDSSADWPQWRGPKRDAVSTEKGLLRQWPKNGPPLLWQVKGMGGGYSSVAVAADKIFTTGRRSGGTFLIAASRKNGRELWAVKIGSGGNAQSTPTVDGDRVYGLNTDGDLVCVDIRQAKALWRKSLPRDFGGRMMTGWGYSESPLVDGEKLVCTPGGKTATLAALNKKTGQVIWKGVVPEGDGAGYASIVISEGGGVRQYIQLLGRGIVGLAAKDGKFLWRYDKVANRTANIPTPIVKGNFVFCSTGYNTGSALLQLVPSDSGIKVEEVYYLKAKELQNHHGGLVPVGDYVYGGHGHNQGFPICVDLKSGEVKWSPGRGPGSGSAAVVYADGNLYFRYQSGLMALIEASPDSYNLKGTFPIPHRSGSPSWSHPVVAGGKLYLREQDWLMCFDLKKK
jgi:outer membrane protein assembly factor BamB